SGSAQEARYDLSGRVSLEGELDLRLDLMPLVKLFGGGAYREVSRFATKIPVRVGGTTAAPKLKAPRAADLARSVLGGLLEDKLSGK
ncbi:MAG: hypothetical protein ACREID_07785, partial [Planctomycetota bacterium]